MPDWCNNKMTLTGTKDLIDRVEKAIPTGLFQGLVPMPDDLRATTSPNKVNAEEMMEKYGHADWYSWTNDNWGTKWDISDCTFIRKSETEIWISDDTAWAPPIAFYEKIEEMGISVTAYYSEPGVGFAGIWKDGDDECYTVGSIEDAKKLPAILDENFDIVETMENMEDGIEDEDE